MKVFVLLTVLLLTSSCGGWGKVKKPLADKAARIAASLSVTHMGCATGTPVRQDIQEQLYKLFKVDSVDLPKSAMVDSAGPVSQLCSYSVGLALPYLVNLGDRKLPASWTADGCSLEKVGTSVEKLAKKLCGMVPI